MNKQIQQLAEQAGFVLWKDESWNPGDVIDWSSRYDSELEKFAQLIVRECAGIYDKIDNGNLHMGTDDYLEALDKTFFGVEE
jgi:hypothetical protein